MLLAVNFHYIRPSFAAPYEAIHGSTPEQFARQLDVLSALGTFVSADEIDRAVAGEGTLPERAIVITLDDGLREQYDHAWPVLQRMGIPAIFYVNTAPALTRRVSTVHQIHLLRSDLAPSSFMTLLRRHAADCGVDLERPIDVARAKWQYEYDPVEVASLKYLLNLMLTTAQRAELIARCFDEHFGETANDLGERLYMTTAQIRELGRYRVVGTHGHEHVALGLLPRDRIAEQIRASLDYLEPIVGYRPFSLSYPFGEPDACTVEAGAVASGLGVHFAFTMERAVNHDFDAALHLGRFDSNDSPGGKRPYYGSEAFFVSAPRPTWGQRLSSPAIVG